MKSFPKAFSYLNRGEKNAYSAVLLARIILVSLDLAGVLFLGLTFSLLSGTQIDPNSFSGKILSLLSHYSGANTYLVVASSSLAFFLLKAGLSLGLNRIIASFGTRTETRMAVSIFRNVLSSKIEKEQNTGPKELLYAVTGSANSAFSQLFISISVATGEIALLATVSVVLAITHLPLFALTAVFFTIFTLAMARLVNGKTTIASKILQDASLDVTRASIESIENRRQIYTSARIDAFSAYFHDRKHVQADATSKLVLLGYLPRYLTEIALILGLCLLFLVKANSLVPGIDAQTVTIFAGGAFRIIASLLPLQATLSNLRRIDIESQMALDLAKTPATQTDLKNAMGLDSDDRPNISLVNVAYKFNSTGEGINGISLEIPFGAVLAVRGKSGSGKSTFADLLIGLREADSGSISIGGFSPRLFQKRNPGGVAYVPQEIHLFDGTIAQNITLDFMNPNDAEPQIWSALEKSGLASFVKKLPRGINTPVGKYGHKLSGGQVQRMGLARAFYQNPKVLILDEATSALDEQTEKEVVDQLSYAKGSMTMIVIAHRPAALAMSDFGLDL
jgi:ABC-type bacteriocin/lantibiotic exporter with double-glycine peptidase domain